MAAAPDLTKLVPGFDFLQGLVKNAGSAMPSVGQWIAPTLDPDEIGKRIEELRTVQFWLEQNARMIATTVQAMEVQRMTLSTLKTMNVQMGDLGEAMKLRVPGLTPDERPAAPAEAKPAVPPAQASAAAPTGAKAGDDAAPAGDAPAGLVDPMQWWNALTQQFTQLATSAVKEGAEAMSANVARTAAAVGAQAPGADRASARKPSSHAAPRAAVKKAAGKTARKPARRTPSRKNASD